MPASSRRTDAADIRFLLGGKPVSVRAIEPTCSILRWLREEAGRTGTKEGCAEGDCGACTVVVGELVEGKLELKAVNACIRLLPTLDGKALFTVEDLRRADGALHPVQQAMVDRHASQCGFCTPGFVMSLWSVYLDAEASGQRPGDRGLRKAISGNLCRCTGYRPILEAGSKMFDLAPVRLDRDGLIEGLQSIAREQSLHYRHATAHFCAPKSLAELLALRAAHPEATLLAGCTDIGLWVNKQMRGLGTIIYLGEARELLEIRHEAKVLRIGAGVTLENAYRALAVHYPQVTEMWQRFASVPIRNSGTLGGNIANGSPIGDSMPWLIVLGTEVVLRGVSGSRRLALEDFYLAYARKDLAPDEIVEAIEVPLPVPAQELRTYKVSKRYDSDISAVCAAFAIRLEAGTIATARIAFGGMAAVPQRARHTEAALCGRPWSEQAARAAMRALAVDFKPLSDMRASDVYRMETAQNLLWRFHLETRPEHALPAQMVSVFASGSVAGSVAGSATDTGKAGSAALPHESAALHVSGEATYTDDIPEARGTLHAALGLSPKAHARIRRIGLDAVRAVPGVVAVLTAADIPGDNDCGPVIHDDPIFADGLVQYVGQPMFAVVATTRDAARHAARLADYGWEDLPAVLTPQEAKRRESYVLPPMRLARGEAERALAAASHRIKGELYVGGQEQFYLEGQISYALPGEDGGMHVYCSTQHPTEMQRAIAQALKVSANRVRVEVRRMGGGFGGKESQSALFACVAAVAARHTGRPVKLRLDRDDDMLATGKRHCFHYEYEAGFDDDGRIRAAKVVMALRAGFSADLSGAVATRAVCHFDNAYYLSDVDIVALCGKTNTQSNTAFRGFGGPQGALAIEYILDDVARELDLDPLDVRKRNFYGTTERNVTPYRQVVEDNVIVELVAELEASSDYRSRRKATRECNASSPVLKRGIALTPVKFGISFNVVHFNQAGALVQIYTDGSVLVNHGGTEMGQGLHTKVAQVVAQVLGLPIERVRATATDTSKVPNTSATAASTGSDLNGNAAEDAALTLRARLAALAAKRFGGCAEDVEFGGGHVKLGRQSIEFTALVAEAYRERIQLWSDGFYATPGLHWDAVTMTGKPFFYFAYGAAVSEVIVDTLTGEWKLVRADLLHDAGNSINPAIDIGQVEGGFIQGMGWLTTEELWWNADGRLMTHSPSTYKIPAVNDCPADFRVKLFENANAAGSIFRSKAVGEPPLLLPFSVLFAIRDAIASTGDYRINPPLDAPATGESIMKALAAVRAQMHEPVPA